MKELKVGMYVRTKFGIKQIYEINNKATKWKYLYKSTKQDGDNCIDLSFLKEDDILKASENIIDLIEPMDLLFLDIDYGYEGGIIVPRIAETMNELNKVKEKIKNGELILKYIVTREQIESIKYEVE